MAITKIHNMSYISIYYVTCLPSQRQAKSTAGFFQDQRGAVICFPCQEGFFTAEALETEESRCRFCC